MYFSLWEGDLDAFVFILFLCYLSYFVSVDYDSGIIKDLIGYHQPWYKC